MKFYSFIFFLFLIIGLIFYYSSPDKYKKYILILLNFSFYSYFDYRFAFLMFLLTSINFISGNFLIDFKKEEHKNNIFIFALTTNIVALGVFKYYNFFIESFSSLAALIGFNIELSLLNIIAPLGISYYLFQTLTYIFDIQFGSLDKKYSFVDFVIFASFFPTIIAGPIERASTLLPQINTPKSFEISSIKKGFALITIGMMRKLLIADPIGLMVSQIFSEPQYYRSVEILVAVILYPIQLYNDFAGYSSIARGVAKLFGFNIISNFKQPFLATSIADFWRRWHISFSFWLRDYLFTPLQLKFRDKGSFGTIYAIMLTFFICGLWHGPTWGNVLWGLIHGIYLTVSTLSTNFRNSLLNTFRPNITLLNLFRRTFIFIIIVLSFLIARADNLNVAFNMLISIIKWTPSELTNRFLIILLAGFTLSFTIDLMEIKYKSQAFLMKLKPALQSAIYLSLWVFFILLLMTQNKLPFIYEKF